MRGFAYNLRSEETQFLIATAVFLLAVVALDSQAARSPRIATRIATMRAASAIQLDASMDCGS
jgi:hypothetical protein